MAGPVPLVTYIQSFLSPFHQTSNNFLRFPVPESLIPRSLARHIETFADISIKLTQLTVVSQLSDIHISTEVKYLHREIPEILTVISHGA